ncbi:hypothetical protein PTSG_00621 [Salpingoeca rosetta]|uniref:Sterol regulatory element-binding protein cleavage-activating protein n=1 Tax=Salpingoeca rosetta (strain ATCC 50818 / BSB-021) TaxID=946362 RepID=F2TX03_SALR5|nr:uncharacterized protein PTSG_00621 [Salpingoeca rosetta]EGD75912.1 hypothetical protein PTSG_00621 [Salpingoeca rosetta]|eukprot:XP_004998088.1 hypothetical protein PTSG_00621 [Salpingoeca rosetta]
MSRVASAWSKAKQQVAYAFYWHGLQCASSPFQVITTATIAALLMSLPAIPSLQGAWPAWRAEVWHEPVADPAHPGAIHLDAPPSWVNEGTLSALEVMQFHITVPDAENAIAAKTLRLAAKDLPTFLQSELQHSNTEAYEQWQRECVRDEAANECVVLHPHMHPVYTTPGSATAAHTWPGMDLMSSPITLSLRAGDARFPFTPTPDLAGKNCKRQRSHLHCDALVVSLILHNSTTSESLQQQLLQSVLQRFADVIADTTPRPGVTTRLAYERRSLSTVERGLLVVAYIVLLLYMINSVSKVEAVMSRAGLTLTAVSIMTASVTSAVGVCTYFDLVKNFQAFEVIPFLVMVIGLDNITAITSSVVSAPPTVAVRFRIAHGLSNIGPQLTVSLMQMETILMLGAFSHIPQLKDFSIVACAAMLCNFSFQVIIYVAVMSLDMRRLELSDLMRQIDSADRTTSAVPPSPSPSPSSSSSSSVARSLDVAARQHDSRAIQNLLRGSASRGVVINAVLGVMSMVATVLIAVLSGRSGPHSLASFVQPNTEAAWAALALANQPDTTRHSNVIVFHPVLELPVADALPATPTATDYILNLIGMGGMLDITQAVLVALGVTVAVFWVRTIVRSTKHALFGQREDVDSIAAMSLIDVEIGTLTHRAQLELFSVNTQQQLVAACSMDGAVSVWDLHTHRHLCSLRDEQESEDQDDQDDEEEDGSEDDNSTGGHGAHAATATTDGSDERKKRNQSGRHSPVVRGDVPWCIATFAHFIALGFNNGVIEVWELHTQYCHVLQPPGSHMQGGRPPRVTQMLFSDHHLLAARDDGVLEAWAVHFDKGQSVPTTPNQPHFPNTRHQRHQHHHHRTASMADTSGISDASPPHRYGHRRTLSAESVVSRTASGTFSYESFNTLKDLAAPTPAHIDHVCSRKCHTSTVSCMSVFGDFIITAGRDACIRLIRKLDFGLSATLTGHTGPISCLTTFSGPTRTSTRDVSPLSATIIVSGSADGSVRVWDVASAKIETVFSGHEDMVTHVGANSIHVVSLGDDDTLRMWDRKTQSCLRVLQPRQALHSLVLHPSSILVTVSNAELTAWDVMASGERIRTIALDIDPATSTPAAAHEPPLHDSHVIELMADDTVLCSFGSRLYVVRLPFPTLRKHKEQ